MISLETAARIWNCYHDIQLGEQLLKDMEKQLDRGEDPNPRDTFGRHRPLTLGIPNGPGSHRLLNVQPRLAISVIRGHIANMHRELAEANESARVELDTPYSPPVVVEDTDQD